MWNVIKGITTILALAALSLLSSYYLSDKLIDSGIVSTSKNLTILLGCVFVFMFSIVSVIVVYKLSSSNVNKISITGSEYIIVQSAFGSDNRPPSKNTLNVSGERNQILQNTDNKDLNL
jgi:hypothetical protein